MCPPEVVRAKRLWRSIEDSCAVANFDGDSDNDNHEDGETGMIPDQNAMQPGDV